MSTSKLILLLILLSSCALTGSKKSNEPPKDMMMSDEHATEEIAKVTCAFKLENKYQKKDLKINYKCEIKDRKQQGYTYQAYVCGCWVK